MTEKNFGMDLDAYVALIDKDLPQPEQFNYEVSRDTIRHFAYAVPDYNALYLDNDFAFGTRWGGIIAPPGYLYSHGYSTWLRMFPGLKDADGRELSQNDNASEDWEFVRPVRPGDTVYARGKVLSVEAKNGRRLGPCALVRSEMRYTNQRAETVALVRALSFRFNAPKIAQGGGLAKAYPPMPAGQITRDVSKPVQLPGTYPTPERRYGAQLYFEDVSEGDAVTPWELGPITSGHMSRFNAATLGVGWDQYGALQAGAIPDAYSPGPMRTGWFGAMLTQWAGPDAWVTKIAQQNHEWVLVGFKVICGGRVTRKFQEGGRNLVDCEIWCESELGFRTNIGSAQVRLPMKGG